MSTRRESVTNSIVPRIKAVLTAAEQTAALVTEEAESEASRRSSELLAVADADAERIRREATRRVEEYLAASRQRIDAFATARIERITELTEGVIEAAASIQERFEQAASVQREVHAMVAALGTVAEAVAREAAQASPTLPAEPAGPSRGEDGPSWAQTGPDGTVVGERQRNGRTHTSTLGGSSAEQRTRDSEPDDAEREELEVELRAAPGAELAVSEDDDLDASRGTNGTVLSEIEVGETDKGDRDDDGELASA